MPRSFPSSDVSRRRKLHDRRVLGQAGELARVGERLAQAAELVDQLVRQRLLAGPHPALADASTCSFVRWRPSADARDRNTS